jgi:hypothetical protein
MEKKYILFSVIVIKMMAYSEAKLNFGISIV